MSLSLEQVGNVIRKRLTLDQDACVAVTGDEGTGKSSLAIQLAMSMDNLFQLQRNVIFSPKYDAIKSAMTNLPPFTPVIADEAIKALYKSFWQNRAQKMLNMFMALARQENKLLLLLIPKLSDLNPFFRNRRVMCWIHIIRGINKEEKEGKAIIFMKTKSPFAEDDIWHYKENQKMIDGYCRSKRTSEVMMTWQDYANVLSRSRNYVGMLDFGHLPDDVFESYKTEKKKFAYEDVEDGGESKTNKRDFYIPHMKKLIGFLHESNGMSYAEVGHLIGLSPSRIHQIVMKIINE